MTGQEEDAGHDSGRDAATISVYDTQAQRYADAFGHSDTSALDSFIAALPAGARVLDLGCGPGTAAAAMRDAGLEVTALDASPGVAAVARDRFGLDVIVGDFDAIPSLGRFAGVWALFSLLHAPRADLPRHLGAIHTALIHAGLFVIGMKTAPREGAAIPAGGQARDALGRRYSYVAEDELEALLDAAGFTVTDHVRGAGKGLDGVAAPWVITSAHA